MPFKGIEEKTKHTEKCLRMANRTCATPTYVYNTYIDDYGGGKR